MSTSNIVAIVPVSEDAVHVIFKLKNGSTRTYRYEGMDALAVLNGSDPADLQGERVR
jgi:hypothetical protein